MTFHISIPSPMEAQGANRRRCGRVVCNSVTCSLGEVVDLSATGAKIRTKFDRICPGEHVLMTIHGLDGPIPLTVQVSWVVQDDESPTPARQMLAGVRFVDIDDSARRALVGIARASASNPTLGT